jgi:5-methylcytosine-specific restriction endonuclease McrA
MNHKNSYYKFNTQEERIAYWKKARAEYATWRRTSEAAKLINRKTKKQQGLCFWCMLPLDKSIHIDHIYPLYLGGSNGAINMCITHPTCNMDKGASVYTTYREAGHRRRQFKLMSKASRANELLKRKPDTKLSKKDLRAIKLTSKLKPITRH